MPIGLTDPPATLDKPAAIDVGEDVNDHEISPGNILQYIICMIVNFILHLLGINWLLGIFGLTLNPLDTLDSEERRKLEEKKRKFDEMEQQVAGESRNDVNSKRTKTADLELEEESNAITAPSDLEEASNAEPAFVDTNMSMEEKLTIVEKTKAISDFQKRLWKLTPDFSFEVEGNQSGLGVFDLEDNFDSPILKDDTADFGIVDHVTRKKDMLKVITPTDSFDDVLNMSGEVSDAATGEEVCEVNMGDEIQLDGCGALVEEEQRKLEMESTSFVKSKKFKDDSEFEGRDVIDISMEEDKDVVKSDPEEVKEGFAATCEEVCDMNMRDDFQLNGCSGPVEEEKRNLEGTSFVKINKFKDDSEFEGRNVIDISMEEDDEVGKSDLVNVKETFAGSDFLIKGGGFSGSVKNDERFLPASHGQKNLEESTNSNKVNIAEGGIIPEEEKYTELNIFEDGEQRKVENQLNIGGKIAEKHDQTSSIYEDPCVIDTRDKAMEGDIPHEQLVANVGETLTPAPTELQPAAGSKDTYFNNDMKFAVGEISRLASNESMSQQGGYSDNSLDEEEGRSCDVHEESLPMQGQLEYPIHLEDIVENIIALVAKDKSVGSSSKLSGCESEDVVEHVELLGKDVTEETISHELGGDGDLEEEQMQNTSFTDGEEAEDDSEIDDRDMNDISKDEEDKAAISSGPGETKEVSVDTDLLPKDDGYCESVNALDDGQKGDGGQIPEYESRFQSPNVDNIIEKEMEIEDMKFMENSNNLEDREESTGSNEVDIDQGGRGENPDEEKCIRLINSEDSEQKKVTKQSDIRTNLAEHEQTPSLFEDPCDIEMIDKAWEGNFSHEQRVAEIGKNSTQAPSELEQVLESNDPGLDNDRNPNFNEPASQHSGYSQNELEERSYDVHEDSLTFLEQPDHQLSSGEIMENVTDLASKDQSVGAFNELPDCEVKELVKPAEFSVSNVIEETISHEDVMREDIMSDMIKDFKLEGRKDVLELSDQLDVEFVPESEKEIEGMNYVVEKSDHEETVECTDQTTGVLYKEERSNQNFIENGIKDEDEQEEKEVTANHSHCDF